MLLTLQDLGLDSNSNHTWKPCDLCKLISLAMGALSAQWSSWMTLAPGLLTSLNFCALDKVLHFPELWRLVYTVALLLSLLVAKRLRESESVWYTVTCYANMRADLYRTIMRINPEYYTSLCVHLRCRGFPPHFAIFACPPLGWVDPP